MIWKIVKMFLDERVQKKVLFLSTPDEAFVDFNKDNIHTEYGGNLNFDWLNNIYDYTDQIKKLGGDLSVYNPEEHKRLLALKNKTISPVQPI